MEDSKQRFTARVADYVQARPSYPDAVLRILEEECGLTPAARIADIGSGTGLLSEVFLRNGNPVWGVEPNRAMREAGERRLRDCDSFISVNGCAETTTLPDGSCDWIVAGQAFHWFEPDATRVEFVRILKPGGWVALLWNMLPESAPEPSQASTLQADYEALFQQYSPEVRAERHRNGNQECIEAFFAPGSVICRIVPKPHVLDAAGFEQRVFSSSQSPPLGHALRDPMRRAVMALFERYQERGLLTLPYETRLYLGRLSAQPVE